MIWNYCLEDIIRGYERNADGCTCTMCGKQLEQGRIYETEDGLFDAEGAMVHHKIKVHGSTAEYLLSQSPSLTGISEVQRSLLRLLLAGKTDRDISKELGIAGSTVRNHRFKLREKEKQAKLYLALMTSLEEETKNTIANTDTGMIEEHHASAAMVDERYNIKEQERQKTLAVYLDEHGALKQFPAKEKKKIMILAEIIKNFKRNTEYTENEVNRILKRIYEEDYPSIRRALIEYGFMDRSADCKVYRVKE